MKLYTTTTTLPALTKREWFAGMIAASVANNSGLTSEGISSHAVAIADALIQHLEQKKP